jgi:superfamily II DNA or RNA helicase
MPVIYDNIEQHLIDALRVTLQDAESVDCCVGYFNLRGWGRLADAINLDNGLSAPRSETLGEQKSPGSSAFPYARVLVGMHRGPEEEMRLAQRAIQRDMLLDGPTAARLRRRAAESFEQQLKFGLPTAEAERALQQLARQIRAQQVRVKLFLRYPLHAKLYLAHRTDRVAPLVAYLGSSNLTQAGLFRQGELNVDVLDQDAARKLQRWFDARWNDAFAMDISDDLADLIETSWAREALVSPYLVYLTMIYHLSEEARQGEREFRLPQAFQGIVLDFQAAAISLTAHHLHRRRGVMLGDVVGLGKTLMATAVAKIFQQDEGYNTLIICPPRLISMWQDYVQRYGLIARVMSLGKVIDELPAHTIRYRLVIIDESQNLRNREGKRYQAIRDYIDRNEAHCLLLTATPYNKQYTDISNQLRLFLDEARDLGMRPERFFQTWTAQGYNEADFRARFQTSPRSLRAFEQSPYPEDWRDLMRLFLVRRTRHFIMENYARYDEERARYYVMLGDQPSYFPLRQPRSLTFALDETDPEDQYARLYAERVVDVIQALALPRYGLANYLRPNVDRRASAAEKRILDNLNRAGRRLIGFCRTNLFKRLESSGSSFLLSLRRHILRNLVTLHALENNQPVPIGTQDVAMLDTALSDLDDVETSLPAEVLFGDNYLARAAQVYAVYRSRYRTRFDWLSPHFFRETLREDLRADAQALAALVREAGEWDPQRDAKLDALHRLLTDTHPADKSCRQEKVLVFTQFADTAHYLGEQLKQRGVRALAVATSHTSDPTGLARRFSPRSNAYTLGRGERELRVLIATDVLAEGQNLQDCAIVVNYDLPWAIVRLIQRAGRVDRIGQQHDTILVYVFAPVKGVEHIIHLRRRLSQRLQENQEVVGTDESFFGEESIETLRDLYTENASVLIEGDIMDNEDVDLASLALQVWNSAPEAARRQAQRLPPITYATRPHTATSNDPEGVLAYLRFPEGADTLVRVDGEGHVISQSMSTILRTAACTPETPALPRRPDHHELVAEGVAQAIRDVAQMGGQLGSRRSTSRKVYERLRAYRETLTVADQTDPTLDRAMDALFRFPLTRGARESLRRQLRLGITDAALVEMVIHLYNDERLVKVIEEQPTPEPVIVCSMGLVDVE